MSLCLNIGCDVWKLPGFTNVDINPKVNPDLLLDLNNLQEHFGDNSVDFIYAGHVFEHFEKETSQKIIKQCFSILKPYRCMIAVVPDWRKSIHENDDEAEKIVLAKGDHKMLMSSDRLFNMLKTSGFRTVQEIINLNEIPYLLVSDIYNPVPDKWQSGFLALKIT
jgi:predicted SAM-dependent methyltransferase